jgi:hypothetical protein
MTPPDAVATRKRWWAWRVKDFPADRQVARDDIPSASHSTEIADRHHTSDLLVRRMRALHLDPDRFATNEGSLFAELTRLCARCESGSQCQRALDDEFTDPGWQAWRDFCPNSTTLRVLAALEGCEPVAAFDRVR